MKITPDHSQHTQEILNNNADSSDQEDNLFSKLEKYIETSIEITVLYDLSREFLEEYNSRFEAISISSILDKHLDILKLDMKKAIPTRLLIAVDETNLFVAGRRQKYLSDRESQQYDEMPTNSLFAQFYPLHKNSDTDAISVFFDGRNISIVIPNSDRKQEHVTRVLGVNEFKTIGGIRADLFKPTTIERIHRTSDVIDNVIQIRGRLIHLDLFLIHLLPAHS